MNSENHSIADMKSLFEAQRIAFASDTNPVHSLRKDRLDRLLAMTGKYQEAIAEAISADFGHRSRHETILAEIFVAFAGIRHARRHLSDWMRTRRVSTPLHFWPAWSRVMRQPLGVVGIVSPWNYPFQMAIAPAIGALAAGNRVLLKPSEITPCFSDLLHRIVAEFFAAEEMAVVTGDAELARAFVSMPFDHLLFTGSAAVGRQVAIAAANNLTPVTLELSGKSPAILDASCDLAEVAAKLAMGKLLNAGQTCIAPDYVLLPEGREEDFIAALRGAVARLYPTLAQNPDYSSIVDQRHYARLVRLLEDARLKHARIIEINPGNEDFSASKRKMPLYIVLGGNDDMAVMQEEIFGPILPVLPVKDSQAAIDYVNRHPRPLALYWFGTDRAQRDRILDRTISGGVTINDTLWHIAQEALPFGGVGASGSGAYHGETGFLTFTKEKPVFFQAKRNGASLLYPPYGRTFERILGLLKMIV
ncbi:MAG: coniferyl aldehyde dehydrogenase [Sterolibacterium sp.]